MTVKALIIDVLQDHARRQAQEIADLRAAQPSRAGAPRGPARFVEEQHIIRAYEWQWAGESWYGRLTLANQNGKNVVSSLRIGELRKKYSGAGGMFHIGPRLVELVEGSFELGADHRLKLDLTVDKTVIGSNIPARQKIAGSLDPRLCFAGRVDYSDFAAKTTHSGDMILIDYL